MTEFIFERYNYWAIIFLMMIGLYVTFQAGNMIKRLVGLSVFQTSVCLFYVTMGKIYGGSAPIMYGEDMPGESHGEAHGADAAHGGATDAVGRAYVEGYLDPAGPDVSHGLHNLYSNPIPHVLILTAIVVGVATLAVGLALVVRTREAYGTIEADEVRQADIEMAETEASAETA